MESCGMSSILDYPAVKMALLSRPKVTLTCGHICYIQYPVYRIVVVIVLFQPNVTLTLGRLLFINS